MVARDFLYIYVHYPLSHRQDNTHHGLYTSYSIWAIMENEIKWPNNPINWDSS